MWYVDASVDYHANLQHMRLSKTFCNIMIFSFSKLFVKTACHAMFSRTHWNSHPTCCPTAPVPKCQAGYAESRPHHSSRIARPRFVARASLTELKAWFGKSASMKSGRCLAMDNSCSLFNKRLVWETFSRGRSCQLRSFNCTKEFE